MSRKPTKTKQKILDVACGLFAEKGYRDVTIQEVCQNADANIASINYYFGSKLKLYQAVWDEVHKIAGFKHFDPGKCPSDPDKAVEYYVNARVSAILDDGPGGWLPKIIHYEMHSPSGGEMEEFVRQSMKVKLQFMYDLAKNFLGESATELQINIARQSFHSQMIHMNVMRRHKKEYFAEGFEPDKEEVKAEMIKMIMGGLRSYREEIRRGES